ncbi:hypothetical protein AAC387_Pa07g1803 [Persea americana]
MGSSEEKEKFVIEKSGDALNYPSSSISLDWQFGGGNLTSPSHLVPPENYSAPSSSSTAMVDSFSSTVWDHPSSQNLGFCSNNIRTSASTSKVIAPRNTSPDSLRSEDMEKLASVGWNNPNLIPRCSGFLQTGAGLLPHSLSQVPMDSAFIERAARLSCFGDFSNMTNPFSISESFNHYAKSGVVQSLQTLHVQSSSGLNVSGEQFQKNDSQMAEVVKDGLPVNHYAMEDRLQKNGGETGGFYRPSDEGKHGIGDPCNGSEEVEFSGSGQEELSVMEKVVAEPLAQALSVKKRKRSNKDVESEQGKGSPQLSVETVKENVETKEKGEQNVTSVMTMTSKKHSKDSYQNLDAPKQDYIHVRARRGQATNSHSLAERVRREKISERMKFLQDLVPGCNKVTGKAVMLDEIINYVQSLQRQVEFLSMKLATVNPQLDFNIEELLSKDIFQSHARTPSTLGFLPTIGITHPQLHPFQQGLVQAGIPSIGSHSDMLRRTISSPLTTMNGYKEPPLHQTSNAWNEELHNAVQMSFVTNGPFNAQELNGSLPLDHMKVEP